MQFNSYIFILVFLPLVPFLYFFCNKFSRLLGKLVLVIGSLFFYFYADLKMGLLFVASVFVNYCFVILIQKLRWKKIFMAMPIVINVVLLVYFKYSNFIIENVNHFMKTEYALMELILPLGISFYSFQQIAYIVAVYRKEISTDSFIDYLVYILYFPKLLMGPLVEPVDFLTQLNDESLKKVNWDNTAYGIKIFCFGLGKKMLLADTFAQAVSWGYSNIEISTSLDWILIMLAYTFEIYFDFSGYSDMAIGASLMFNITLPINFDSPYKAYSIREFWSRWHISLTKFFTKYIYIPLGGSRKGKIFTYINTMVVFLVSGIWHGANWTFILWGILHGALCVFDRIFEKVENIVFKSVRCLITFSLVNVLWLLFRSDSITQWCGIIKKICLLENMSITEQFKTIFVIPEAKFISNTVPILNKLNSNISGLWLLAFMIISFVICLVPGNNYHKLRINSVVVMFCAAIIFVLSFLCLSGESVFVYFNF